MNFDTLIDFAQSDFAQNIILALATAALTLLLTARGRLFWGISHGHTYLLPRIGQDGNFNILTQTIWLQNFGRGGLNEVLVVLNYRPQHYEIWPPREFSEVEMPDGRISIRISNVAGHETFSINLLDTFRELPRVVDVRHSKGLGTYMEMWSVIQLPTWVYRLLWLLIIFGVGSLAFWILQLLSG